MPGESNGGGGQAYCFTWGGEKWGKDFPGWTHFKAWLEDHGTSPNEWIDNHPAAAKCIDAVKDAPPPPPTPPPPPPAAKQKCFDWGGSSWGKDYPGWKAFSKWLTEHNADPNEWVAKHPDAAKCIGATVKQKCFDWGGSSWGKDYPGWKAFSKWLTDHGADPGEWIAKHPDAAKCIGAPGPPPPPPGPPPPGPAPSGGPPPTPPPPVGPRSRWTSPPWQGRGAHVAWGFTTAQFTPAQLAQLLADNGYRWSALEGFPADNARYFAAYRDELHARGLPFGIWERTDQVDFEHVRSMIDAYEPDFYLADVEVDWSRPENTTLPAAFASTYPDLPRAVLIAGMPDAPLVKPWIDADFDCMTQAYAAQSGTAPGVGIAGAMDNDAYWRGWPRNAVPAPAGWGGHDDGPHTWPVLEIRAEGNPGLAEQLESVAPWGDNFSVYLAETMTDDDWAVRPATPPAAPGLDEAPPGSNPGAHTDDQGLQFCFEWGGQKWGADYPGWEPFRTWLLDRGADPDTWILAHQDAATCLNVAAAEDASGQTKGVTFKVCNPWERGGTAKRHDQGMDHEGPAHGHVRAICDGHVYAVHDDPGGFGKVIYYACTNFGETFYVGHGRPLKGKGDPVTAGEAIVQLVNPSLGNAGVPWWSETGFSLGTAPTFHGSEGARGGDELAKWLDAFGIAKDAVCTPRTTHPPKGKKALATPGITPLPTATFKEPPLTKSAWSALKHTFARKVPARRSSATAILADPRSLFK